MGDKGAHEDRYEIAESTFFIPTRAVVCRICRCRFDSSTVSPSTIPSVPTPAPARYAAAGQPSPPAPMMRTFAFLSRSCPMNKKISHQYIINARLS